MKEHPRCNVVSVRLTDEEMEALKKEMHDSKQKISDLVREALLKMNPPTLTAV